MSPRGPTPTEVSEVVDLLATIGVTLPPPAEQERSALASIQNALMFWRGNRHPNPDYPAFLMRWVRKEIYVVRFARVRAQMESAS